MTDRTMRKHLVEAAALRAQIADLQKRLDKHQDALKGAMQESGMEEYSASGYKATYKPVTRNLFDSTLFRAEHKDMYESYRRPSTSMRFTLV